MIEKTGIKSYALFSDVAAQKLNLLEYCEKVVRHSETYEHLGEVPMCVHDLQPVWAAYKEKSRQFVSAQDAWVKCEVEVPYPAAVIWEFLTKPELEAGFDVGAVDKRGEFLADHRGRDLTGAAGTAKTVDKDALVLNLAELGAAVAEALEEVRRKEALVRFVASGTPEAESATPPPRSADAKPGNVEVRTGELIRAWRGRGGRLRPPTCQPCWC